MKPAAICFGREHGLFTLAAEQWLPSLRDEVFPFFADAANLNLLTPPWLRFEVLRCVPVALCAGARIDYRLQLHGLPIRWQSEITEWSPPCGFVDEQRRGPYRVWIHEHGFEERDGGTLVCDRVRYAVFGGAVVERLLVRRDLQRIFGYRQRKLAERFQAGAAKPAEAAGRRIGGS